MKPFLRQVADHYLAQGGVDKMLFVFPNRRSMAFFKKHLAESSRDSGHTESFLSPQMMAVSDFFSRMTDSRVSDRITLLLDLYDCYAALNPKAETLDDFIYWGDVLIGDFNDADKYMVDVKGLFANISDYKSIQDDYSYLTEEQIVAISKLANHFTLEGWGRKGKNSEGRDVKENFMQVWMILHSLYDSFRTKLRGEGRAYEGMVYRDLAERLSSESAAKVFEEAVPGATKCVFVGLNALCKCEKVILKALQKEGMAEFCWDFSSDIIKDPANPASLFMSENVRDYPQSFSLDPEGLEKPHIHVISVPSATGQAKLLPGILKDVPTDEKGLDFSVVLPDETMLMPVLGSIPDDVEDVNVTMGFPLASSEWTALMRSVIAMQLHFKGRYLYHKQVHDIFSCGLVKGILTDEEKLCVAQVQQAAKSYIPIEDVQASELFTLIFSQVIKDQTIADAEQDKALGKYLSDVTFALAGRLDPDKDALHMECARQYYCCVNRLSGLDKPLLPKTWCHMLEQLVAGISVPFSGEPLGGLQVMGPLETRALDFKRIVILNANDSIFPRRSVSSSFIPPEMRKAFGLPTYEYQDAVWAYYFYRMIERARDVWMIYDSRAEGMNSGEESRYIKQLRYLYADRCFLDEAVAVSDIKSRPEEAAIAKTEEDIAAVKGALYSASTIQRYISCPASFYYYIVKGLKPEDEINDSMDAGMLGTVCHDTLRALYCGDEAMHTYEAFDKRSQGEEQFAHLDTVTLDYLKKWLKDVDGIRAKVISCVKQQIRSNIVEGRDLVAAEIAVRFVQGVIRADIKEIKEHGTLRILGLEKKYIREIAGHKFIGYIDRLDSFDDGTVRVVDYKTGSDRQRVLDPEKPLDVAFKAFGISKNDNTVTIGNPKAHEYKAALQFFIYDTFIGSDKDYARLEVKNAMYSISDIFTEGVTTYPEDEQVMMAMRGCMEKVFSDMENPEVPFRKVPAGNRACKYCDYKVLCGRFTKD